MYTIPKIGKKKFIPNFTIENKGKTVKYSDINKKKKVILLQIMIYLLLNSP